jgi:hypothetical protein
MLGKLRYGVQRMPPLILTTTNYLPQRRGGADLDLI